MTEGALAGITLTRSGNIDEGLSLTAHVLETGAMLAFPAETPDGKPIIRDLQFSASSTTATLQEATVDDTTDEPDSEITFCPDTAGGDVYRIELPVCVSVTVLDDDGEPVLSIMDAAGTEDSVGNLAFEVRLSEESGFETAVDYATSNGTATAGDDYTPTTGTLTFAAGQVANTINVPVLLDGIPEENETFTVVLSNAVSDAGDTLRHGTLGTRSPRELGTRSATGTILDDDPVPASLSIADAEGLESDGALEFPVTVGGDRGAMQTVTVDYATSERYGREQRRLRGGFRDVDLSASPASCSRDFTHVYDRSPA